MSVCHYVTFLLCNLSSCSGGRWMKCRGGILNLEEIHMEPALVWLEEVWILLTTPEHRLSDIYPVALYKHTLEDVCLMMEVTNRSPEQGKWRWQDLNQKYYLSFLLKISCHFNLVEYSGSTFTLLTVFLTLRNWLAASGEHSRTCLSQMQRDPARPGFFADSHHGLHQLNKPPAKPAVPAAKMASLAP